MFKKETQCGFHQKAFVELYDAVRLDLLSGEECNYVVGTNRVGSALTRDTEALSVSLRTTQH